MQITLLKTKYKLVVAVAFLTSVCAFTVVYLLSEKPESAVTETVPEVLAELPAVTERFSARVDRVDVLFEHTDYTRYRLVTNGLVREGELNTERGYAEDENATVYVLNWQEPVGKQQYFVRLTAEPDKLYVLDGDRQLIRSGALSRDTAVQQ